MKKTISKIAIAAFAATMTITSMMSISASANDGMTKEESDAAAVAAESFITETTDNSTADGYIIDSAEEHETTEAATEAPVNIFAQGNWYSRDMSGIIDYWFNPDAATGVRTCEGTGNTENFSYDFSGNRIVFYYGTSVQAGTVSYSGYDMIISWDNGFVETLSTTYPTIETQPAVTTVATTEYDPYNQPMLARGTWYASSYTGTRTYCFDLLEPVGNLKDFDGTSKDFDYTLEGNDLWLHFTNAARGEHAVVTYNADGSFSLSWASGLVETFTLTDNSKAPVTTPVKTETTVNTTVTTAEAKKTTNTTAAPQVVTTTATQAVKKAPATAADSPKTGDKFPVIAITVAAVAAGIAGIASLKKSPKK